MKNFYYKRKSKEMNTGKDKYVEQMLNTPRNGRIGMRIPKELENKLKTESKPANVIIKLLADHYYRERVFTEEEWAELVADL